MTYAAPVHRDMRQPHVQAPDALVTRDGIQWDGAPSTRTAADHIEESRGRQRLGHANGVRSTERATGHLLGAAARVPDGTHPTAG